MQQKKSLSLSKLFCLGLVLTGLNLASCADEGHIQEPDGMAVTIPDRCEVSFCVSTSNLGDATIPSRSVVVDYGNNPDYGQLGLKWKLGLRFAIYDYDKNVVLAADPVTGDINPDFFSFSGATEDGDTKLSFSLEPGEYYYVFWCDASGYDPNGDTFNHRYNVGATDNGAETPFISCNWDSFTIDVSSEKLADNNHYFYNSNIQKLFMGIGGIATGHFSVNLSGAESVFVQLKSAVSRIVICGENADVWANGVPFGFAFETLTHNPDDFYEPVRLGQNFLSKDYYVPCTINFSRFDDSWQIDNGGWVPAPSHSYSDWDAPETRWTIYDLCSGGGGLCGSSWCTDEMLSMEGPDKSPIHCISTILAPSEDTPDAWGIPALAYAEWGATIFSAGGISDIFYKLGAMGFYGSRDNGVMNHPVVGFKAGDQFLINWHE